MSILELFCSVDDFWQQFAPNWQKTLMILLVYSFFDKEVLLTPTINSLHSP